MLYNLEQLVQLAKEDLALRELPPAVSDKEILERVKNSALKDFSIIYPRIIDFNIGVDDQVDPKQLYSNKMMGVRYNVPLWIKQQYEPLAVISVDNISPAGYADVMWPYGVGFAADSVMSVIGGIKAAAAVGQNITNSLTFNYDTMNQVITVFNGWTSGSYHIRMTVAHDASLATVPSTAMMSLRELIMYDIGQFVYNTMKRKNKIDSPAGTIELNIDDLADCANKKRELIERLMEDAELDYAEIDYY